MRRAPVVTFSLMFLAMLASSTFTPVDAAIRERSLEAGAYLLFPSFDDESNVDDEVGFGGRFGIVFEEEHELEFSFDYVDTNDDLGLGLDVELSTFKVGYVYNFLPRAPVSPLFTIGGGFQNLEISEETCIGCNILVEDETDALAYGGFGVRFFVGPTFNIRLDGQAQAIFVDDDSGDDETLVDGLFMVGVGWVFGGH